MRILVTGAGGFIGKNLIATLRGENEVLEYHHTAGLETLKKILSAGTVKKLLAVEYVQECLKGGEPT